MAQKRAMIVTFRDGRKEVYKFTHQEVHEGELHFWTEYPGGITYKRHDEYYIPLDNVYVRKVEEDY